MDNGNDKQRIAEWRAKRRRQRTEQEQERNRTRQFGGHFFLEDDEGKTSILLTPLRMQRSWPWPSESWCPQRPRLA